MNKIRILVVEPNKEPYTVDTTTIQKTLYGLVYYPYLKMQIQEDTYLIYSREANDSKDSTFKKNRVVNSKQIYGTFVIVKNHNNKVISLSDQEIKKLKEEYK